MSADFSITVEPERDLVRIRMAGFFTREGIAEFVESRRIAHAQLTCARNQHVTVNDLRGMKIQSQEIVEAFREMLAEPSYRSRRLAFVVSPTLARTQLTRAVAGRDVRFFEDSVLAEAWLFAADDARAA
jgi:hypothetical protein